MGSLAKMRSGGGHPITAIADTQIINNFVYHTWSIRLERKYIYRRVYLGHIALHGAVGCAGGSGHYQIILLLKHPIHSTDSSLIMCDRVDKVRYDRLKSHLKFSDMRI